MFGPNNNTRFYQLSTTELPIPTPCCLLSASTCIPQIVAVAGIANPKSVSLRIFVLAEESAPTTVPATALILFEVATLEGLVQAIAPRLRSLAKDVGFMGPVETHCAEAGIWAQHNSIVIHNMDL